MQREDYNRMLGRQQDRVILTCAECRQEIYDNETRYEIPVDGGVDIIHEDCLKDWAEYFKFNKEG